MLRCELDGSHLEVVHRGLRNPQELAFDAWGNLFTGDNNSDGGDKARWVWVVDGGDSGWQIGYQWLGDRGAWNREKLWLPAFDGQAAWIVPPIDNVASGPSGLTCDPGTGLPDRWHGCFLLCDFRGAAAYSGIWALRVEPRGASFALTERERFLWKVLATDVDFAADGGVLLTDWVHGWGMTGRGRVFRVAAPDRATDDRIAEVKALLAADFATLDSGKLVDLLAHRDFRIRQKAEFALVDRTAVDELTAIAQHGTDPFARYHAIWGLGVLARQHAAPLAPLVPLCADPDPEVRIQAIRVLGDARFAPALRALIARLGDESPRVRFHAAIALGRLGDAQAVAPLCELLRDNQDRDAYLRHAGVMGLLGCADDEAVATLATDADASVRMAALLVERHHHDARIAGFLDDAPRLAVEAARAIHDLRIGGALDALAQCTSRKDLTDDAFARRAIDARRLLGRGSDVRALVDLAARDDVAEALRVEALEIVGEWPHPRQQDRVIGAFLALPERSPLVARGVIAERLPAIARGPLAVAKAAIDATRSLDAVTAAPALARVAGDDRLDAHVRAAALRAVGQLADDATMSAIARTVRPEDPLPLREASIELLGRLAPHEAVPVLASLVRDGDLEARRNALHALTALDDPAATDTLRGWAERLANGTCPPDIALDVLEITRGRGDLAPALAAYDAGIASRSAGDPLASYRIALAGGDAAKGEKLFREHPAAQCARCHTVDGTGGDAGPKLDGVGKRLDDDRLLRALIEPSAELAKGFESVSAESAMPPMGPILSLDELRDVLAFLKSRR